MQKAFGFFDVALFWRNAGSLCLFDGLLLDRGFEWPSFERLDAVGEHDDHHEPGGLRLSPFGGPGVAVWYRIRPLCAEALGRRQIRRPQTVRESVATRRIGRGIVCDVINDLPEIPSLEQLQAQLAAFARERDWGQFHTPKNLVLALVGEVGELAEIFQWLSPESAERAMDDPETAERIRHELADVFAYLLRLSSVLNVNLASALEEKIEHNAAKYPVHLSRGSAVKYTRLEGGAS